MMKEEIRKAIKTIKAECENHLGANYDCDGCSLRMADEGCFLGMNPKLPCNWDLGNDLGVNLVDNLGKTKEVTTMAKNLIPEVCKLLGVEVGEEFKIKGCQYENRTFFIHENGNVIISPDENGYYCCSDADLMRLLTGAQEIIKLPWKPKDGEKCWTFVAVRTSAGAIRWKVWSIEWAETPDSIAKLEKGWVFRNREEAKAALPAVAAELGVEYEL